MVSLFKKVTSFKSLKSSFAVKGVLKIVESNGVLDCNVIITNLTIKGVVSIRFFDGVNALEFDLKNSFNDYFKLENFNVENLTCGLVVNGVLVAYASVNGKFDNETLSTPFNALIKEYDDEALPTYNYYENERFIPNENFNVEAENSTEKTENYFAQEIINDETDACQIEGGKVFFESGRISEILKKYPEENNLSCLLPNAKFVSVNYDAEKRYFVGETTFDGVNYTCVAVRGYYGGKGLENSFFIPLSVLNLQGEGYYVSFKNSKTGETVKNLLQ